MELKQFKRKVKGKWELLVLANSWNINGGGAETTLGCWCSPVTKWDALQWSCWCSPVMIWAACIEKK